MKNLLDSCRWVLLGMSVLSLSLSAQTPPKTKHRALARHGYYNIASGTYTGEMLRGPATVEAYNLNTIRYHYAFGSVTTYQAAQNLWTNLSTLATQTSTQPVSPPATAPAPQAASPKRSNPAPQNATPSFAPVAQAITQANSAVQSFTQTDGDLQEKWKDFTGPINQLSTDTTNLRAYQNTANAAIGSVTQAGAALTAYLSSSNDETSELVTATITQLATASTNDVNGVQYAADSIFIQGIRATWPVTASVLSLQNDLASNTSALNNANAELSGNATSELPTTQGSLASLTAAQSQLNAAYNTFAASNTPTKDQINQNKAALDGLSSAITTAQKDVASLNQMEAYLTVAIAQNGAAVTAAAALAPSSTTYSSFVTAQQALIHWRDKMSSALQDWKKWDDWKNQRTGATKSPDPFAMSSAGNCEFAFSRTKDTVITLTRVDLTPGLSNPTAQTVLTVTVECTSPFSLSAGVVFSTIPDDEYTIAATPVSPGSTTTVNTISQTSGSNFHPLPLAMVNTRMYEFNERVAVYGSFGVAANIRNQSAGGSTAEYLIGPSIGFFRTMIITAGAYLGSRASVGGGYSVNAPVPSTLTSVPINTNYTAGFGLGISFTTP